MPDASIENTEQEPTFDVASLSAEERKLYEEILKIQAAAEEAIAPALAKIKAFEKDEKNIVHVVGTSMSIKTLSGV